MEVSNMMSYENFKNTIARLRQYEEAAVIPCAKADYRAEILWLKEEYVEYWKKLNLEEKKVIDDD